jgi:K+-sensing histidine kinase KdpD
MSRGRGPGGGNARRLEALLEERSRELNALEEINRALAQPMELEPILARIVEEAARLTEADGAGIAFVREGRAELEVGPSMGILSAPPNRVIPLHGSITGRVVRTGVAEVIPDVGCDPEQYPLEPNPVPTRSAIAVPLRTTDRPIGGLIVLRGPARPPYDEAQGRVLQRFADQAAIAIEQSRLVQRLADANRVKDDFLASLSHELRTPLTGILLWADLLSGEGALTANESAAEGISIITQSAERLLAMVENLLDLGRLDAGRLRLDRQATDLAALLRHSIASFRHQSERAGLRQLIGPTDGGLRAALLGGA